MCRLNTRSLTYTRKLNISLSNKTQDGKLHAYIAF